MSKAEKHQALIGKIQERKKQKRAERKALRETFESLLVGTPLPANLFLPLRDCTPGTRFQSVDDQTVWGTVLATNECSTRVYMHDCKDTRLAPSTAVRTLPAVQEPKPQARAANPEQPQGRGPSTKEQVYRLYEASPGGEVAEQAAKFFDQTGRAVQLSTIRGWLKQWAKGNNLPACATKGK